MHPGWIGAVLGTAIGVLGGAIGTYISIKNTRTAAERAFMVRAAIAVWVLVGAFVTAVVLVPQPYNWLLWIPYPFALVLAILWGNRRQAQLRAQNDGKVE